MSGPNLWIGSYDSITRFLQDPSQHKPQNDVLVACAVMQTRATLEARVSQERANEDMVAATRDLVAETKKLVSSTKLVAWCTAGAAVAAGAAAIVAAAQ